MEKREFGFWSKVKRAFIAGVFLCLPVAVTIYIISWLLNVIAAPARGIIKFVLDFLGISGDNIPFLNVAVTTVSAILVVVFLTLIGLISSNLLGKWFFDLLDRGLERLPMVRSVYSSIKQIIDTFGSAKKKDTFRQAVLVEFPRKNVWTIAFLTSSVKTEFCNITNIPNLVHVFVPTTPNPTGGYMIFVPENEIKLLDISVSDAMKIIVSGGALVPEHLKISSENSEKLAEVK